MTKERVLARAEANGYGRAVARKGLNNLPPMRSRIVVYVYLTQSV